MYLRHAGLDPASMNSGPWLADAETPDLIRGRNNSHLKQVLLQFMSHLFISCPTALVCPGLTVLAASRRAEFDLKSNLFMLLTAFNC